MNKVYPSHNVPPKFGPRWLKPTIKPAFFRGESLGRNKVVYVTLNYFNDKRKSDKAVNITLAVAFIFVLSLLLVEWLS